MNKITKHIIVRAGLAMLLAMPAAVQSNAQTNAAPLTSLSEIRAEELKNLKWGMFICWSFSTFSGSEWTSGIKDVAFFEATDVDTDQWARTAKEAGMGYILFLTKHHDGFCLWDTKTTDRKVTKAPLGRDVLAELRKSCDKYGIKLALYFSESEWRQPGGLDDPATPEPKQANQGGSNPELKKAQLKELLTQYGPIEYIWFDHAIGTSGLNHEETVKWCNQWQPGTLIGFNHGEPAGEISLREVGRPGPLGHPNAGSFNAGNEKQHKYLVAEFTYPILPPHEGGAMWFYSLPKHDNLCLPAQLLYNDYLGAVKYGNIFSIDVGPNYQGKLRDIDVQTLRQVGEMIKNPPPALPPPVSEHKPALASSVWGAGYEADKAVDGDTSTRWGAGPGSRSGWVEVDLQKETKVSRAMVMEIGFPRTQEFAIEYKVDDSWKTVMTGTTFSGLKVIDFPPVTARLFRLNILKASEVPTIEEFQLYPADVKPLGTSEKARGEEEEKTLRQVGETIKNPPPAPPAPVPEHKPAQASSVWGVGYEADKAVDGDTATRWAAAPGSRSGWVEVDLQKETKVSRAVVMEISHPRTQEFAIECKVDDSWKTVVTGTTFNGQKVIDFPPVTARLFRLNILKADDVPTIEEFQLYPSDVKPLGTSEKARGEEKESAK